MPNTTNSPVVDILSDDEIYDDIQITHTARVTPPLYTNPNTHIHTSNREPILIPSDESDINDSYYDNNSSSNGNIYNYNHNNNNNNNANYTHNHNNNNNNNNDNDIQFIGETEIPQPVIQETGFALHLPSARRFIQMPVDQIVHGGGLWRPIVTTFSYPGGVPMNREGHNHYAHDQIRNRTRNARRIRAGLSNRRTRSQDHDEGSLAAIHRFFTRLGGGYGVQTVGLSDDGVPDSIMEELQRRDVMMENRRIDSRSKFASKVKKSQESDGKVPGDLKKSFTNAISSVDDSLCALCGVILAEGIPDNYKEDMDSIRKDDSLNLRKLVLKDKFRSPWQSWKSFTDADLDLSKKVFFGRCGHVYCGRCVNNIVRYKNMPSKEKKKRNRKKTDLNVLSLSEIDFENAEFSAPTSCIAPQCNRRFNGRYFFRELYI